MSKMELAGLLLRSLNYLVIFVVLVVFGQRQDFPINNVYPAGVHVRFEYKYSFKPPYLAQKDGSIPFWQYGGSNVIASSDKIRLAQSLRSQKGAAWTKAKTTFKWWEVDIQFRITGRGRVGADGLAFWYMMEKGGYDGHVFGSSDKWNGLGIIFDSFDNDNKDNNPYIMAVINNGTMEFDHANDGRNQMLGGCLRDFRNKQFPTAVKISYYERVLTVLYSSGMTANLQDYEVCLRVEGVDLPEYGYFGISAATGGLADDHDVIHFLTSSLHAPGQFQYTIENLQHTEKLQMEFKEYQEKLEKQKIEYKQKHPEFKENEDPEEQYENDYVRALRQIWQAQTEMIDTLRALSRKMDELMGRQENTLSLVSQKLNSGSQMHAQMGQQPPIGGPAQVASTMTRPEIDAFVTNQNAMMATIREIRTFVGDIQARIDAYTQNQQQRATSGHVQPSGYDIQSVIAEMRDGMNQVKQGVAHVGQKLGMSQPNAQTACPTVHCVGVTLFLGVTVVQLLIVFLYSILKSRSEAQAKKFY